MDVLDLLGVESDMDLLSARASVQHCGHALHHQTERSSFLKAQFTQVLAMAFQDNEALPRYQQRVCAQEYHPVVVLTDDAARRNHPSSERIT